jgi:hypothetical protein
MIREYTTRAIPFSTDKLLVVSALALRVGQQTGNEYRAGF